MNIYAQNQPFQYRPVFIKHPCDSSEKRARAIIRVTGNMISKHIYKNGQDQKIYTVHIYKIHMQYKPFTPLTNSMLMFEYILTYILYLFLNFENEVKKPLVYHVVKCLKNSETIFIQTYSKNINHSEDHTIKIIWMKLN